MIRRTFRAGLVVGILLLLVLAVPGAASTALLASKSASSTPFALGTLIVTGPGPADCPSGTDCVSYSVSCPDVIQSIDGYLSVGSTPGPTRGMATFFTGAGGLNWLTDADPNMPAFMADLRNNGIVTVESTWATDWRFASSGEDAGLEHLSCRAATVIRYVYDVYYLPLGLTPAAGECGFCLIGNSGGASQISYALEFYGLEDILNAVIPSGGPTYGAVAKSCMNTSGEEAYQFTAPRRDDIDHATGYLNKDGPCRRHDASFVPRWLQEGIATGSTDYVHETTRIHFIWGDLDTAQQAIGGDYKAALIAAGSPDVTSEIVPNTDHRTYGTPEGRAAWKAAILWGPAPAPLIEHVVVLVQDDHSFDNVLGVFCTQVAQGSIAHDPCDGTTTGELPGGGSIALPPADDLIPKVKSDQATQLKAIHGGAMDLFTKSGPCKSTSTPAYACLQQFDPSQIPNVTALATTWAVSDRTFEFRPAASWGGRLTLAAATLDGFQGNNPVKSKVTTQSGPGSGCDSFQDAPWWNGTAWIDVPACVPDALGQGPYRSSPVPYVPTIFDRLDAAGRSWKIYAAGGRPGDAAYKWSICPAFYECLAGSQRSNFVAASQVLTDAATGTLPDFSIVTPLEVSTQHTGSLMSDGDDWIGQVVSAIQGSPDWGSTAVFLTWADCGCFYDHVDPTQYDPNWGPRVPTIIISPFAKPAFTDSTPATTVSILAFVEGVFDISPLTAEDAAAYDYANAFDFP